MGHTQQCPYCRKVHRWSSWEIKTLKTEVKGGEIPYPTKEELSNMGEEEKEEWEEIISEGLTVYDGHTQIKNRFGVICPHCNGIIIISDDFNDGDSDF
ncbi:MAG: hypothetical protein GF364_14950 [Candidatus Lokiarchaeota archaeon]|nr:hypothetical protein [Candidatus Lokiarchaeota archaeon]